MREEVIGNILIFYNTPDDLVIHIRSDYVFINHHNRKYGQLPLCFYQILINDNNLKNIYLKSSGHENPKVDKFLQLYPKIKFINETLEDRIFALSTFPFI